MPRNEETIWNRFSSIYDRFIKKDEPAYHETIQRISAALKPEDHVLEIATGTGIIALGLAGRPASIEAVDFSADMVAAARQKAQRSGATGVRFAVMDAYALAYAPDSFDAVIIANALHIMPEPAKALAEIRRVLKPDGLLFAPTFIHAGGVKTALLSRLMSLTGFRAYHKWTFESYQSFLEDNGFTITDAKLLPASFPLAYMVGKQKL